MGRRTFNVGEIARILGVPASTLRFWEKKSLFRIGKGDNQYRQYTTTDLIRIADTVFYRNMGIPISQINDFLTVPLEDHGAFLETMQVQLNEKIMQYRQMEERLRRQRTHYACLKQLLEHPYTMEEVPFQSISPWEFWERENLNRYIEDPTCYVWFRNTAAGTPGQKGLIRDSVPGEEKGPPLWVREGNKKYLTFPVRALEEDNYQGVEAEELLEQIGTRYETGAYFAQHLLTCMEDGKSVEYLKGYLELIGPK